MLKECQLHSRLYGEGHPEYELGGRSRADFLFLPVLLSWGTESRWVQQVVLPTTCQIASLGTGNSRGESRQNCSLNSYRLTILLPKTFYLYIS
jgi:hypothetical protein